MTAPGVVQSRSRAAYYLAHALGDLHLAYRLANLACSVVPGFASGVLRTRLYRLAGIGIHPTTYITGNLELVGGESDGFYGRLTVGPGGVIGNHVTINLDAEVRLEQNVSLGPFVKIYTATHPIGPGSNRRVGQVLAKPVRVGRGSWIGLGAMILPGVTIGNGCIVAAGAVVTTDMPDNSYVEGNPAKVVDQLPWGNR
ncbi:MAG: acyltransferase [Chloroflexi bacterium]|nr:acyltransferase [Chloroflexota bacterium]MBV9893826.1 acyltransferase [Chloroflexota bacterium]